MNSLFCLGEPAEADHRNRFRINAARCAFFDKAVREPVHCAQCGSASPSTKQKVAEFGFTDARRILQHRLEDRLKLAGRT